MSALRIAQPLTPLAFPQTATPPWRRLLDAFTAHRQRQADRLIARSLAHHGERLDRDFRLELERRLMGQ